MRADGDGWDMLVAPKWSGEVAVRMVIFVVANTTAAA